MAIQSFLVPVFAITTLVHGIVLPLNDLPDPLPAAVIDAPTCSDKAQGTTSTYTASGNTNVFDISCGEDYYGGDLRSLNTDSFQSCLEACSTEVACTSVAYNNGSCYLKKKLTSAVSDTNVWSAKKKNQPITNAGLSCDGNLSDGTTYPSAKGPFKITCGKDYYGNDLTSTGTDTFEACIQICASTPKCVDVS
jgi:hypothetical protein